MQQVMVMGVAFTLKINEYKNNSHRKYVPIAWLPQR